MFNSRQTRNYSEGRFGACSGWTKAIFILGVQLLWAGAFLVFTDVFKQKSIGVSVMVFAIILVLSSTMFWFIRWRQAAQAAASSQQYDDEPPSFSSLSLPGSPNYSDQPPAYTFTTSDPFPVRVEGAEAEAQPPPYCLVVRNSRARFLKYSDGRKL